MNKYACNNINNIHFMVFGLHFQFCHLEIELLLI